MIFFVILFTTLTFICGLGVGGSLICVAEAIADGRSIEDIFLNIYILFIMIVLLSFFGFLMSLVV